MGRRFKRELSLLGCFRCNSHDADCHLRLERRRVPTIEELSLMPVTGQWLPIEDSFEQQLIARLARDRRVFVKGLRYNLSAGQTLASVNLTDAGESPVSLCIAPRDIDDEQTPTALKGFALVNRFSSADRSQVVLLGVFLGRGTGRHRGIVAVCNCSVPKQVSTAIPLRRGHVSKPARAFMLGGEEPSSCLIGSHTAASALWRPVWRPVRSFGGRSLRQIVHFSLVGRVGLEPTTKGL